MGHNLFQFVFYWIIPVSWLRSHVCQVNPNQRKLFFWSFLKWFFYFYHSKLVLLETELNLFWFSFYKVISLITRHVDWWINMGWPESIQYIIISLFIKNLILIIYFGSNYIFTGHLGCFWPYQVDQVISG